MDLIDVYLRSNSEFYTRIQRVIRIRIHCTHEIPLMRHVRKDVAKILGEIKGKGSGI